MENENDRVTIKKDLITKISSSSGSGFSFVQNGVIEIEGSWLDYESDYRGIILSGNSKMVFTGVGDIHITGQTGWPICIPSLEIENASKRNITMSGQIKAESLLGGDMTIISDNADLSFGTTSGNLTIKNDVNLAVPTKCGGNIIIEGNIINNGIKLNGYTLKVSENMTMTGDTIIGKNGKIMIIGDLKQTGGVLYFKEGILEISGNYFLGNIDTNGDYVQVSAGLQMENENDLMNVQGNFIYISNSNYTLNKGKISVAGDFTAQQFIASGIHITELNGEKVQTVTSLILGGLKFNCLKLTKNIDTGYVFSEDNCWNELYGTATVTKVKISPSVSSVFVGESQQFKAIVSGYYNPSQNVIWSISGNTDKNTTISQQGILYIGANETASQIVVKATAKDDLEKYAIAKIEVLNFGLNISLNTDKANVKLGDKVNFTSIVTGGTGNYLYSYLVHNKGTGAWSRLTTSFTPNSTFVWMAGSEGNREFFAEVKDDIGIVIRSNAVNIQTLKELSIKGVSNISTAQIGDKIVIQGTASGGNGNYTYSYLLHNKDTNQWSRLTSSFINSNSYTWTAGSAGNCEFFIEVKDSAGDVVRSSALNVKVTSPLSIIGKTNTSEAMEGSKVIISGIASGGSGNYTYSYLLHNKDTNQWSRLTPSFISGSSYTWTAGSVGNREFFIEVKDNAGKVVRSSAVSVNVKDSIPLKISGRANITSAVVGDKVIISGIADGGKGSYTYSYLVHNKDTNQWSRLTPNFVDSNSYIWVAGSTGNREFFVEVKDSTGKIVRSSAVNVKTEKQSVPLSVSAEATISQVSVEEKVVILGAGNGGNGDYTYSYLVHNKDTNQWSRLTPSFITNNTYTWTAGSAGNREFFVEVKDSTGEVVRSSAVNVLTK